MSDLTYQAIGDLVRQRLNLPVDARLRMQALVNTALQRLGAQVAQDQWNRQYIMTDPATVTLSLANGIGDLTTLVNTNQVQIEYITYGFFWPPNATSPLQWKRGRDLGNIRAPFDGVFPHCWLEGMTLYTKGTNGQGVTGPLGAALVAIPTLANLKGVLDDNLLDQCVGLAQAQPLDFMEQPGGGK